MEGSVAQNLENRGNNMNASANQTMTMTTMTVMPLLVPMHLLQTSLLQISQSQINLHPINLFPINLLLINQCQISLCQISLPSSACPKPTCTKQPSQLIPRYFCTFSKPHYLFHINLPLRNSPTDDYLVSFQAWITGKPEEDAEAHLLRTNDWMRIHKFDEDMKVQRFCLTLLGEARLWYKALSPIANDWPALQNAFRWQYSKLGNTQDNIYTSGEVFTLMRIWTV